MRCYHSDPGWIRKRRQRRGTPYSLKVQHYWILTIRLFSVISMSPVGGGVLHPWRDAVGVFYHPNRLDLHDPEFEFTTMCSGAQGMMMRRIRRRRRRRSWRWRWKLDESKRVFLGKKIISGKSPSTWYIGVSSVMDTVVENRKYVQSSNPGSCCLHST